MVTTTTADSALKSYYLDAVSDQLDYKVNPFFARIKRSTTDVYGKDVRKIVRLGLIGGIGAGAEDATLPKSGKGSYATFVAPLKNLYGTIEISDKALRASASNEGAFVNILNEEMEQLIKSASYHFDRMLFGDGKGYLAKILKIESGTYTVDSVDNLCEGMGVDVCNASETVASSAKYIEHVDRVNKTVTLMNGVNLTSTVNGHFVLQNSFMNELTGLKAIFEAPTLYGVNRAENSWLMPHTYADFGEITEMKLQTVMDEIESRDFTKVNFIITSWGVRRALAAELSKNRKVDSVELEGGFRAITFNGIPVIADRFCPEGTMYLLNTDDFCLHQLCDWQWLEGDNGSILKQLPDKPVYSATLVKYAELMCSRPFGQARITGITEV